MLPDNSVIVSIRQQYVGASPGGNKNFKLSNENKLIMEWMAISNGNLIKLYNSTWFYPCTLRFDSEPKCYYQ